MIYHYHHRLHNFKASSKFGCMKTPQKMKGLQQLFPFHSKLYRNGSRQLTLPWGKNHQGACEALARAAALSRAFNLLASMRAFSSSEIWSSAELLPVLPASWFGGSFGVDTAVTMSSCKAWDGSYTELH